MIPPKLRGIYLSVLSVLSVCAASVAVKGKRNGSLGRQTQQRSSRLVGWGLSRTHQSKTVKKNGGCVRTDRNSLSSSSTNRTLRSLSLSLVLLQGALLSSPRRRCSESSGVEQSWQKTNSRRPAVSVVVVVASFRWPKNDFDFDSRARGLLEEEKEENGSSSLEGAVWCRSRNPAWRRSLSMRRPIDVKSGVEVPCLLMRRHGSDGCAAGPPRCRVRFCGGFRVSGPAVMLLRSVPGACSQRKPNTCRA